MEEQQTAEEVSEEILSEHEKTIRAMEEGMKECPDCIDGEIEVMTDRECTKHMSECCGGCSHMEECPTCEGSGEVFDE
ncbi:MAG: hypothetical protein ACQ9ET_00060 [Nitrosomonadaceae bacterium]